MGGDAARHGGRSSGGRTVCVCACVEARTALMHCKYISQLIPKIRAPLKYTKRGLTQAHWERQCILLIYRHRGTSVESGRVG